MTQYSAAELELLDAKSYDAATDHYYRFMKGQVTRAEARAYKLGRDLVVVKPTDIDDIELYLQELLGFIAFTELQDEYVSS
jgi:acyl-coenzyme A thioesterase PaaI-like protein